MNERSKEIMYAGIGVALCLGVLGNSVVATYLGHVEHTVELRVFETDSWDKFNKRETLVMTWGDGKYYFLGNWTGQFHEGHTYNITYVQQAGSDLRQHKDLIVLSWEEI